ncbi:hypothetical protein AAFF_G00109560 [Aldrovandia affinis]|uniref:Uncharacterized protein n=1 Tax=Aldrovandia affinis TaxID=143900 RepID=A0AAD7RTZ2_9TELE|nr:hypothetical protein AAFF_G00109560 [Aldrovandia affinis]
MWPRILGPSDQATEDRKVSVRLQETAFTLQMMGGRELEERVIQHDVQSGDVNALLHHPMRRSGTAWSSTVASSTTISVLPFRCQCYNMQLTDHPFCNWLMAVFLSWSVRIRKGFPAAVSEGRVSVMGLFTHVNESKN